MDKNSLFLGNLSQLDISPTLYREATMRYDAVASILDADIMMIYPHGSFATGTVVRPFREDKDQAFDLDMICEVQKPKNTSDPLEIRGQVKAVLSSHASKLDKPLKECDRCFTLQYAPSGGLGFNMDIVPAVPEDEVAKGIIIAQGIDVDKAQRAIAIVEMKPKGDSAEWQPSNPSGYAAWFNEINAPFAVFTRNQERQRLFSTGKAVYASVQEVPRLMERSALQRVVQYLKRHRDVYFCRTKQPDQRPASVILTTLAATAAQSASNNFNSYQLLEHVVNRITMAQPLLENDYMVFSASFGDQLMILREGDRWILRNPVNPSDILTDAWTIDTARHFFQWLNALKKDVIDFDVSRFNEVEQKNFAASALGILPPDPSPAITNSLNPCSPAQTPVQLVKPWRA
jgi:hypothetical protein